MIPASLRTVLSLGAAFSVGVLVTWGLFQRFSTKPAEASILSTSPAPQVAASPSPTPPDESFVAEATPSPAASANPSPSLIQQALNYNKELYDKYPGLQPPLVNTDGRNLGPEALQRMQSPTILPNPGGSPAASVSPNQPSVLDSLTRQSPTPNP